MTPKEAALNQYVDMVLMTLNGVNQTLDSGYNFPAWLNDIHEKLKDLAIVGEALQNSEKMGDENNDVVR